MVAAADLQAERELADAIGTILGWTATGWRAVLVATLSLAGLIVVEALLRGRWALLRDVVVAIALVAGIASILGRTVESHWLVVGSDLFGGDWGFPDLRIAVVAAAVSVAVPEVISPVRMLMGTLIAAGCVGLVALGAALPSDVLGALSVGLGAAALVRLVFGSAAGVPPVAVVSDALRGLDLDVRGLAPAPRQRIGVADYVGHDAEGGPLRVRVLGRDAHDVQRLAQRWRALAYRDPPRRGSVGRLEQVEHEALATLLAGQAGVGVPEIVTAALGADGDALIVTRQPPAEPVEDLQAELVDGRTLRALWVGVARLHGAGVAHGRLHAGKVILADGAPLITDFSAATLSAPKSARDIDVAELLVSTAALVGPEPALRAAIDGAGAPAIRDAIPYVQAAAVTPHTRERARTRKVAVDDLRSAAADATGTEAGEIVPIRRFRLRDIVVTALIAVAAYALISQLAEIGLGTVWDEVKNADIGWVVLALVLAQLPLVAQAVSFRGAVATPLPLLPCTALQSALKVVNLTVPGSAGRIALNVRFLQRMGAPTGEAVAAGGVDNLSEVLVQVLLILAILPFVDIQLPGGMTDALPSERLVATILITLIAVAVVVLAVPALRARVVPAVKPGFDSLRVVFKTRRKRLELFGGNIASELLFALTLGAAAMAYGIDLPLAQLLLVNMIASALSGLVPVPGGVGAQEAALTAGLVAFGVDESTAFAIAITHRMCTYFLPPIWGAFALRWLRRQGYV